MPVNEATIEAFAELFPEGDWVDEINDQARFGARLERLGELAHPDLEVEMIGPGGFSGSFRGVGGFEEAWRDWLVPFASYRVEQEPEVRKVGEAVVFFAHQIVTPKGTANPIEGDAATVAFFEHDKLRRLEFHLDRAMALRSAGLES
jgi:hypothetical protein